jgi:hypothetical protein
MKRGSSAREESPTTPRRARGRPKRETIENENLSKVEESDMTNDISKRFLQKMKVLKVRNLLESTHLRENGN